MRRTESTLLATFGRKVRAANRLRRVYGGRALVDDARLKVSAKIAGDAFRLVGQPSLRELAHLSSVCETSATAVLRAVMDGVDDNRLRLLSEEYSTIESELVRRVSGYSSAYPDEYRIGRGGAFLLFAIVRLRRPAVVLETGVADGYSSFFILHALLLNDFGRLISCDTSKDCGGVLEGSEKVRWTLEIVDPSKPTDAFLAILSRCPNIDLFIHDSDHSYRWQTFEFQSVKPLLTEEAAIVCDDADASFAFLDFAGSIGRVGATLVEDRKVVGIIPAVRSRTASPTERSSHSGRT